MVMKLIISHKVLWILIASLAIGFAYTDNAIAAEKNDKAARRAQQMLQKARQDMEQEKVNMQTQFDLEKKELEEQIKINDEQLKKRSASLGAVQRKLGQIETEKTALESKLLETQTLLEMAQKNLEDLTIQHKQAQLDLKINDTQRKTLTTNLASTNLSLRTCEQKNSKLHQFSTDLIKIYDKPSIYNSVMRDEPFFQLKRVELENILQDQQDKVDDEKVFYKRSGT
jgi:chromosome segregation ATPase